MSESDSRTRWVLYVRKSGPGDKSPADQEKVGRRDIEAIGGVVVAVRKDNLSASRYRRVQDRPGFAEARDDLLTGHADGLWTFAHNRSHRDLDDYVPLRRLCIDHQIPWRYGGRTYELWKAADRQAANSDAIRAEGQSDDISEAVNRGIQESLEEGKAHGKLPRGYRIVRDANSGKAIRREPIPEQAALIQEAADRVIGGEPLRSVTAWFTPVWQAAGGRGFVDQRVLRGMLLRPTYAGLRTYKGEVKRRGDWDPILTLEQHDELRAILTDPKRLVHRGTEPRYLLSYLAVCGVCGAGVVPRNPRQKTRALTPTYRCSEGHVSRSREVVDRHVEELLLRLFERPDARALLMQQEQESESTLDEDMALIERLESELEEYVREAASTSMSARAVAVYVEQKEKQIREARARMDEVASRVDPLLLDSVGPDARRRWKKRTLPQRREIIRRSMSVAIVPAKEDPAGIGVVVSPLGAFSL